MKHLEVYISTDNLYDSINKNKSAKEDNKVKSLFRSIKLKHSIKKFLKQNGNDYFSKTSEKLTNSIFYAKNTVAFRFYEDKSTDIKKFISFINTLDNEVKICVHINSTVSKETFKKFNEDCIPYLTIKNYRRNRLDRCK